MTDWIKISSDIFYKCDVLDHIVHIRKVQMNLGYYSYMKIHPYELEAILEEIKTREKDD